MAYDPMAIILAAYDKPEPKKPEPKKPAKKGKKK
jgi:hypothetical protein